MDVINIIMYINIRTLSILQGLQPIFVVALLIVGFSFRQKISDTVAGIDKKIAEKFLAAEYSDIEKGAQRAQFFQPSAFGCSGRDPQKISILTVPHLTSLPAQSEPNKQLFISFG